MNCFHSDRHPRHGKTLLHDARSSGAVGASTPTHENHRKKQGGGEEDEFTLADLAQQQVRHERRRQHPGQSHPHVRVRAAQPLARAEDGAGGAHPRHSLRVSPVREADVPTVVRGQTEPRVVNPRHGPRPTLLLSLLDHHRSRPLPHLSLTTLSLRLNK